jgi:hypothetical protein
MGANLMAAKVKGSGKYDYRVTKLSNKVCKVMFKQRRAGIFANSEKCIRRARGVQLRH